MLRPGLSKAEGADRQTAVPADLDRYRSGTGPLPERIKGWQMHGTGFDAFGREGGPDELPLPTYGPDELLVRIDAVGLCASDVKLITAGSQHPRIFERDLASDPTIPGHEVSLTVVGVGDERREQYQIGQRFIVQADVFYRGENTAFGYALPGGMTQYQVIGKEMLEGDEGSYLLPVDPATGYAEAALTEPWACVVAAYRIEPRATMQPGGFCWLIGLPDALCDTYLFDALPESSERPTTIVHTGVTGRLRGLLESRQDCTRWSLPPGVLNDLGRVTREITGDHGWDDIIILGTPPPDFAQSLAAGLARHGALCIVATRPMEGRTTLDVGRVHYDFTHYLGGAGPSLAAAYRAGRARSELVPGGRLWIIGAAGPMGQMHVQRALEHPAPPALVVGSDVDSARLSWMMEHLGPLARERNVEFVALNPTELSPEELETRLRGLAPEGFDDVVVTAPVGALAGQGWDYLAPGGVLNIFAGVPRGTTAEIDLTGVYLRDQRIVGSSGSRVADLRDTLDATQRGELATNRAVAAIGGINAVREGLEGVKTGRFHGKVVIFPQIDRFDLTPLDQLGERLPEVAGRLAADGSWTREAEEALLEALLPEGSGA